MKKVAIVGVEGSGKTVMLAGLGDLYTYPDEDGYFLAPKNFETAAYVAEKIARMRKGEWPVATAGDEMQGLDWTLKHREPGVRKPPEMVCEVSFLDFAGEVYRAAYGITSEDSALNEQVEELRRYVGGADELIVLINLRDVIANGLRDKRVQEAMWITKSILDAALGEDAGENVPRAAIVLSQADSYAETIGSCGGAPGVLEKYLPHVANEYGWLDVFAVNAVDKTMLDGDGNTIPAADFTTQGLLPILKWIRGVEMSSGVRGCGKVQLWEGGPYWAETNIGAENPWDHGYYFWWGDTLGYKRKGNVWVASDRSSSHFSFEEVNTPTCKKSVATLKRQGILEKQGLIITADGVLSSKNDAAHVRWGGAWRMPIVQELDDLCSKCDWGWTTVNGVNGCVVSGRGDYASHSIFLPAAGRGHGTSRKQAGSYGGYWASVPRPDDNNAWFLWFSSSELGGSDLDSRARGLSVRPVQGFTE